MKVLYLRALLVALLICIDGGVAAYQIKSPLVPSTGPGGGASIVGVVLGPDAKPVPYATVSYFERYSRVRAGAKLLSGSLTTDKEGRFGTTGLVAGTYQLCASASSVGLLDPCLWAKQMPLITLSDGVILGGIQLRLESGAKLHVRLDDPQGHLDGNEGKKADSSLTLCVRLASDLLVPVRTVARDKSGKDLEVLVPAGSTVTILVLTKHFQVDDPSGNPVNKADGGKSNGASGSGILGQTAVIVPVGVKAHSVKFLVKGYQ